MTQKSVLVTGAAGGIGRAICRLFGERGWRVVATDRGEVPGSEAQVQVAMDLERFATDGQYRSSCVQQLTAEFPSGMHCLVNNAAHQYVAPVEDVEVREWHSSFQVNVTAPFLLVRELLEPLEAVRGSVVNISSIHARLTKAGFSAYATSKAALEGVTRALAVELGDRISVNAIAPAAIETPMLVAGFEGSPEPLNELGGCHPSGCIGRPEDVAMLALQLAETETSFLNGAIIGLDGGIASRLHDPA